MAYFRGMPERSVQNQSKVLYMAKDVLAACWAGFNAQIRPLNQISIA